MADDAHLALACTPGGQLYLDARPGAPGGGLLSRRRASALLDAFSAELGGGLVHLASAELERELPASLAFGRLLGQRYLEALCHQPDLETRRADLEIAAPTDALTELAEATPPMRGGEYVTCEVLEHAWHAIEAAVRRELALSSGTVADYLHDKSPLWRVVGRLCFHLAENRRDPAHPFAFMATYGREVTAGARVRHAPLKAALREFAADRDGLLRLLEPVHRAAQASDFVR
ncbi:MAG: ATP-dependent helicase, partial [Myxococcales bacterium]|nr:ATP-dependent helicase [Myxococcales bacterium]